MRIVRALPKLLLVCAVLAGPLGSLRVSAAQVTLAWNANAEPDISGYKIWCSSSSGQVVLNVGNVTSAVVPNLAEGGSYTFYATAYNTSGLESAPSTKLTYTVPTSTTSVQQPSSATPPTITTQPKSQTVYSGAAMVLSVAATGSDPLLYQWYHDGVAIANGTNSSFQISSTQTSDAGNYIVQVSNPGGLLLSQTAAIKVSALPVITRAPKSLTVPAGNAFSLLVVASSPTPVTYQWYKDQIAIAGATAATYFVNSAKSTDAGTYYVKVKNASGTATSSPASITLGSASATPTAPVIALQPASQTVLAGSSLSVSIAVNGSGPMEFQWYRDGVLLQNVAGPTLQIAAAQSTDSGSYTVTISNAAGSITTTPAAINVLVAPAITSQPIDQNVAPGATLSLAVQASGSAPMKFQWFRDGTPIQNATDPSLQVTSAQLSDAGNYTVVVANGAGVAASYTAAIKIGSDVLPPVITVQPLSQTLVAGGALSLSVQASGTGPLQYQWYHDGFAIQSATSPLFQIASVQLADAGNYTVQVSNSAGKASSSPAGIQVTVPAAAPTITQQPASQTINVGNALSLSVAVTGSTPLQFQWYRDGTALQSATSQSFQIGSVQLTDAGKYTVRVSNSSGSVTSLPATIQIVVPTVAPSITRQPLSQTVIAGGALNLSVEVTGSSPLQFQWYRDGTALQSGTSQSFQIPSTQLTDSGNYTVRVSNSAGSATSLPAAIQVTLPTSAPIITIQPVSQNLTVGTALNLAVEASGSAPLQYQWFRDGTPISGANSPAFQIASSQTSDSGSYTVRVSNSAGSATSTAALVSISAAVVAPTITTQPLSQTLAVGDALTLSVEASGSAPLQYQWFFNGFAIQNATGSKLTISSVQALSAGSYYATVANSAGVATSSSAKVTIAIPPTITGQPSSQTLVAGAAFGLTVQAAGTGPLAYQWYHNGVAIENATSAAFQIPAVTSSDEGNYTVAVTNIAGAVTSAPATLVVQLPPVITVPPTDQAVVLGAPVTFSVEAAGSGPLSYRWSRNGVPIQNATSSFFQIASVQSTDAGSYSVKVSNAAGSTTSPTVTLSLIGPPVITTQPLSQALSVGSALKLSVVVTGTSPFSYQWFRDGTVIDNATSASFEIGAVQSSDAGSYTCAVSNSAGTVTSAPAVISVAAGPLITSQPVSQTVAVGSQLTLSVQASGAPTLKYQWYRNGITILRATSSTLKITSVRANDAGSYTVKVSNSLGTVASLPAVVTVAVPPTITVQPVSQTLVAGAALNLSVEASGSAPFTYQWYRNNQPISGATTALYKVDAVQSSDAASYYVIVANAAGTAKSSTATITLVNLPVITAQPLSQTLAAGAPLDLSVQALSPVPLKYQWYRNGSSIPSANSATYHVAAAGSGDSATYTVKVSNTDGVVTSSPAMVTVLIAPTITTHPLSQTIAPGAPLTLTVQATGTAPLTYQWFRNGLPISGAINSTLQIAAVQSSDAGTYTVKVQNTVGAATSYPATVTVGSASTDPNLGKNGTVKSASLSPASMGALTIARSNNGTLVMRATGIPGRQYQVLGSAELGANSWSAVATVDATELGLIEFSASNAEGTKAKFFKVIENQD